MSAWQTMRLDECCEIVSGATPSTSVASYWDGEINWATPKDLSDLNGPTISTTPRKITKAGLEACAANILPVGSVLFSSRAPIGHVAINATPMATNQGFKSFVPHEGRIYAGYLYHWLRCNRSYLEGLGNGATFKEVSKAVVSRIELPVPPFDEQRRIAAILDEADALRAKRRAALAQLDDMARAIFDEMFGDPEALSARFPQYPLSQVAQLINGDRSARYPSGADLVIEGVPFFSTKNISRHLIDTKECNFITAEKFSSLSQGKLRRNDLIITMRGTLGQCVIFDCVYETGFINAQMMIIRPGSKMNSLYLREYFSHPNMQSKLQRIGSGSAVAQLTGKQIGELLILAPPFEMQLDFGQRIAELRSVQDHSEAQSSALDSLFASLQHRAFRGEL